MKRTAFIMISAILFITLTLSGACFAKPIVLKYGCTVSPETPLYRSMVFFSVLVNERTNGAVQIKTYPLEQLGTSPELAQGVANGTVDMTQLSPGEIATVSPPFEFLDMPFLFNNLDQTMRAVEGPVGQEMSANLLKSRGIRVLAWAYFGVRYVTSKKPLRKAEDFKGFKIRTWPARIVAEGWSAAGANPTPMAFGELYTGLQQGIVEGQSNVLVNIETKKLYEVQKYMNQFNDNHALCAVLIHEKAFQKIPPEYQKVVIYAAEKAAAYAMGSTLVSQDELMKKLKTQGMEVIVPEPGEIQKLQKMVYETVPPKFMDRWGEDLFNKVRELTGM